MTLSCSSDPNSLGTDAAADSAGAPDVVEVVEYPPDRNQVGPFSITESQIVIERTSTGFRVHIPVQNDGPATENQAVDVEILKILEDANVAHATFSQALNSGLNDLMAELAPATPIEVGQEYWYLVSWRIETPDGPLHGSRSLGMTAPQDDLVLMVPLQSVMGEPLTIKAIATRAEDNEPLVGARVLFTVDGAGMSENVVVETDRNGQAMIQPVPSLDRSYSVSVAFEDAPTQKVEGIGYAVKIQKVIISTDEKLYKPGDTVHMRLLGWEGLGHTPLRQRTLHVVAADSARSMVYDKWLTTDQFGAAWDQFPLGEIVNAGSWEISVSDWYTYPLGKTQFVVANEGVARFNVTTTTDKPWYKLGDTMQLGIDIAHFYGPPASVSVKVIPFVMRGSYMADSSVTATTDASGHASVTVPLPSDPLSEPPDSPWPSLLVALEITADDGRVQQHRMSVPLVANEIRPILLPESQVLVPGVSNRLYLMLIDPLGNLVAGTVKLSATGGVLQGDGTLTTSDRQLSTVDLALPEGAECVDVSVELESGETFANPLCTSPTWGWVLLRPDRLIYEAGSTVEMQAFASEGFGDAYFHMYRSGVLIYSGRAPFIDGVASVSAPLDPAIRGEVALQALRLSDTEAAGTDALTVMVLGNRPLEIDAQFNKEAYEPGESAHVEFSVKDADGQPQVASLGISVTDIPLPQAGPLQSGATDMVSRMSALLAEMVMYLSGKEISVPTMATGLAQTPPVADADLVRELSRALLAKGPRYSNGMVAESLWANTALWQLSVLHEITWYLTDAWTSQLRAYLVAQGFDCQLDCVEMGKELETVVLVDPWGNKVAIDAPYCGSLSLRSMGPDEVDSTPDDLLADIDPTSVWPPCPQTEGDTTEQEYGEISQQVDSLSWAKAYYPSREDAYSNYTSLGEDPDPVTQSVPTTLLSAPSAVTDSSGKTSLDIPLADSGSTWTVSTLISTLSGQMTDFLVEIPVVQAFSLDVDFPPHAVVGDEFGFLVRVTNGQQVAQTVDVTVEPQSWFDLVGPSSASLNLQPGAPQTFQVPVVVTKPGQVSLLVSAQGATYVDAAQVNSVVELPGAQVITTQSGTLDWQVTLSHALSVDTLPASGPSLTLDVALDSAEVAVPGVVEVALTLGYSQSDLAGRIAVVELEVPAGFVALAADLRQAVREQKIRAFEVAGGLVRLYIQLPYTQQPTSVTLGLLATMSAKSQGAGAHAYMLYDKATQAVVLPQVLVAQ